MKKLLFIVALILVGALLVSCSSDDSDLQSFSIEEDNCHCARHVYYLNEDEERTYFMTQEVTTDCDNPTGDDIEHESGRQVFYGDWDCATLN